MKQTILILFLFAINSVSFGVEKDVFQESLDKFEKYCFDQNDDLREDVFVKDEMYSCKSELEYLQHEFKRREELMSQHPEVYDQYKNCVKNRNNPKISDFAKQGEDLGDKASCLEEEKKEFEKDCSKAMQCNVLRSVLDGVDVLPSIIEKPVKNYIREKASSKGYSKECMADDKSNCLEDFSNALIDNLWSSATSIFNLAKTGFTSLFNMTGFFDSQSDKAMAAMNQSKDDVKTFMDSPGEWLVKFYDDLLLGVDTWVRSSVFCQKWKYNSDIKERGGQTDVNSSTFRTCIKPLESYACIDCDDKINATCIALGALTAELGVAFITAGVGTAASFATKASAQSLSLIAKQVSTKIKAVAPKLSKKSTPPTTKLGIATKATTAAIGNATKVAMTFASISTQKALRVKAKIGLAIQSVKNTKIIKITSAAIEKGNIPARVSEHFGTKGAMFGAKVTAKLGRGAIQKEAKIMVKASNRASKSARAKEFIEDRSHGKKRVYTHTSKSHKAYEKGEYASAKSNKPTGSSQSSASTSNPNSRSGPGGQSRKAHETSKDREISAKRQREVASNDGKKNSKNTTNESVTRKKDNQQRDQKLAADKKARDQKLAADKKARDQKLSADKKARDQKLAADKKARDQKRAADKKAREDKLAADKKEKDRKHGQHVRLAIAGVTADLAVKGINISNKEAEKEIERLERHSKGKGEKLSRNLSSAKKVLGVEGKSVFSEKSIQKVENLKEMYSDKNKESIVSNMIKSNPAMSQTDAERAFSKRQDNVNNASDYIDRTRNQNQNHSRDKVASKRRAKNKTEISNLQSKLAKAKNEGELSTIKSELASLQQQKNNLVNTDNSKGDSLQANLSNNVSNNGPSAIAAFSSKESYPSLRPVNSKRRVATQGSSAVSQSLNASNSSSESTFNEPSSNMPVDSLDDDFNSDAEVALIDGLHEAQGKINPSEIETKENEIKLVDTEKKDRKKSKNLKDLLGLISNKGMRIEKDVPIKINLENVKTVSSESVKKLDRLKALSSSGKMASKLVTYNLDKGKLEVYYFSEESYSLAISNDGQAEMLSDSNSKVLIENSIGQVE